MSDLPGLGFDIEHIVVVMFENRSFNNLLGALYPYHQQMGPHQFEGIPPDASNPDNNQVPVKAWTEGEGQFTPLTPCIPTPDPGERFQNVNFQLYGNGFVPDTPYSQLGEPNMQGFVQDYTLLQPTPWIKDNWPVWPKIPRKDGSTLATSQHMMHYFSPSMTPVTSALAKQYAVCDQWFASVATQTFANRMFAHAASSDGGLDDFEILEKHLIEGYKLNTVFEVLDASLGASSGPNWRIYYDKSHHSYSISELLLNYVKQNKQNMFDMATFADDVSAGLPPYTFIEPNYGALPLHHDGAPVNSYHPPFNVLDGENFLWDVYNTLKTSNPEAWNNTLLLVTFDEHGGCYDHFAPPQVPGSQNGPAPQPPFDRYGVRVPTLMISPNIKPGTLFRATSSNGQVLDHTSIIRTVLDCFVGQGASINARDENAPSFAGVMSEKGVNPGISEKPAFPAIPIQQVSSDTDNHLTEMWKLANPM